MKKLVLAAIAGAFLVCPAYAGDFSAEQAKELEMIAEQMLQNKDDAAKMDILTQKKECVEKAADLDALQACLTEFTAEKLRGMAK